MCVNKQKSRSILHWIRFYIYATRSINKYMNTSSDCSKTDKIIRNNRKRTEKSSELVIVLSEWVAICWLKWTSLYCLKRRFFCLICLPHRMSTVETLNSNRIFWVLTTKIAENSKRIDSLDKLEKLSRVVCTEINVLLTKSSNGIVLHAILGSNLCSLSVSFSNYCHHFSKRFVAVTSVQTERKNSAVNLKAQNWRWKKVDVFVLKTFFCFQTERKEWKSKEQKIVTTTYRMRMNGHFATHNKSINLKSYLHFLLNNLLIFPR